MVEKHGGMSAEAAQDYVAKFHDEGRHHRDVYWQAPFFRTNNYNGNTTLCMARAVSGCKPSFGSDGPPGAYADLETADVVFLVGSNLADNHPILCNRLRKKPGQVLIAADPRVTKTAMMADLHLPVKPRSDIALLNGIAHILLRDGLIDRDYLRDHVDRLDEFVRFAADFTPEAVSVVTGLPVETIETVASIYGRAGASPFSITGRCNAMGTRERGFASSMPGYRKFDDANDREQFVWSRLWFRSAIRSSESSIPTDKRSSDSGIDLDSRSSAGTLAWDIFAGMLMVELTLPKLTEMRNISLVSAID